MKQEYIEAINKLMAESNNLSTLDLVYQILSKAKERAAQ